MIDDYLQSCSYYYTDGSYNAKDYKVVQAEVQGSNGMKFDAYELYPASTPARAYLAIKNRVAYKFSEKCDW